MLKQGPNTEKSALLALLRLALPQPLGLCALLVPMLPESAELSSAEPLDAMVTRSRGKNEMRCAFNALTDLRNRNFEKYSAGVPHL